MTSQKFTESFICDCYQPHINCTFQDDVNPNKVLIQNTLDITDSLIEVMTLCGIRFARAKASAGVIIPYFLNFKHIIRRIASIPSKSLKEYLVNDLEQKCGMSHIDAQIAYSIIRRSFRAFYFGTGLVQVSNPLPNDQLTHSLESPLDHAIQRIVQTYSTYKGDTFQKNLERKIDVIYKQLYHRICERIRRQDDEDCPCFHGHIRRRNKKGNSQENSIEDKTKVCSPRALMHADNAESFHMGCSQGSSYCRWFPISKKEHEADDAKIKVTPPEEFPSRPPNSVDEESGCTREDCECSACVYSGEPKSGNDDDDGYDGDVHADVHADADADANANANAAQSVIKDDVEEELEEVHQNQMVKTILIKNLNIS